MTTKNEDISKPILDFTIMEVRIRPRKLPQHIAGLSATLGALAFGLVYGWTSPAGENGSNLVYSFDIDPNDFSWISSIFNIGAATICIPIGILTNLIGRRRSMLILTVPFMIGWACIIWPNSVATLIVGRFLLGISGGAFCVTAPMYTAEIADIETRGRLGSYFELQLCAGILIAYTLSFLNDMFTLSLISATVPLIFFAIFFFMPETPTYYLIKGNIDAARETLIWLRGPGYDVEAELSEKLKAREEYERNQVSFFVAIRSRAAVKGLLIGYGLMFFETYSGIDVVIYYASSIFAEATGNDSPWSAIVIAIIQFVSVFLFIFVVDRLGRRVMLMFSGTVMCLSTLVLGVYFYFEKNGTPMDNLQWLPLTCLCSFIIAIEVGFNPISWMMIGELFSPKIKGIAGSSACFFNWMSSFVVTKFYSQAKREIGPHGTFWFFSAITGLSVVFVFFMVPETKDKSLDQIQRELSGKGRHCSETSLRERIQPVESEIFMIQE